MGLSVVAVDEIARFEVFDGDEEAPSPALPVDGEGAGIGLKVLPFAGRVFKVPPFAGGFRGGQNPRAPPHTSWIEDEISRICSHEDAALYVLLISLNNINFFRRYKTTRRNVIPSVVTRSEAKVFKASYVTKRPTLYPQSPTSLEMLNASRTRLPSSTPRIPQNMVNDTSQKH
jgi:hypothetical protein